MRGKATAKLVAEPVLRGNHPCRCFFVTLQAFSNLFFSAAIVQSCNAPCAVLCYAALCFQVIGPLNLPQRCDRYRSKATAKGLSDLLVCG
jgi:hypothetical protein